MNDPGVGCRKRSAAMFAGVLATSPLPFGPASACSGNGRLASLIRYAGTSRG